MVYVGYKPLKQSEYNSNFNEDLGSEIRVTFWSRITLGKTEPVIGDFVNGIYLSNGLLFKAQRWSLSMTEETK